MKKVVASYSDELRSPLFRVNHYLERNFLDFFAEARFDIDDDSYFS